MAFFSIVHTAIVLGIGTGVVVCALLGRSAFGFGTRQIAWPGSPEYRTETVSLEGLATVRVPKGFKLKPGVVTHDPGDLNLFTHLVEPSAEQKNDDFVSFQLRFGEHTNWGGYKVAPMDLYTTLFNPESLQKNYDLARPIPPRVGAPDVIKTIIREEAEKTVFVSGETNSRRYFALYSAEKNVRVDLTPKFDVEVTEAQARSLLKDVLNSVNLLPPLAPWFSARTAAKKNANAAVEQGRVQIRTLLAKRGLDFVKNKECGVLCHSPDEKLWALGLNEFSVTLLHRYHSVPLSFREDGQPLQEPGVTASEPARGQARLLLVYWHKAAKGWFFSPKSEQFILERMNLDSRNLAKRLQDAGAFSKDSTTGESGLLVSVAMISVNAPGKVEEFLKSVEATHP